MLTHTYTFSIPKNLLGGSSLPYGPTAGQMFTALANALVDHHGIAGPWTFSDINKEVDELIAQLRALPSNAPLAISEVLAQSFDAFCWHEDQIASITFHISPRPAPHTNVDLIDVALPNWLKEQPVYWTKAGWPGERFALLIQGEVVLTVIVKIDLKFQIVSRHGVAWTHEFLHALAIAEGSWNLASPVRRDWE